MILFFPTTSFILMRCVILYMYILLIVLAKEFEMVCQGVQLNILLLTSTYFFTANAKPDLIQTFECVSSSFCLYILNLCDKKPLIVVNVLFPYLII